MVSPSRYEFRATLGMKLFCCVFLVLGLGVLIAGIWSAWHKGIVWSRPNTWFFLALGSLFSLVGGGILYSQTTPVIFDLHLGYFLRGRKSPERCEDPGKLKHYADLKRIHALQLITEHCSSKNGSYPSYELNLVLTDGSRINVIDHGGLDGIRADAQTLAAFLNKPLWDAI